MYTVYVYTCIPLDAHRACVLVELVRSGQVQALSRFVLTFFTCARWMASLLGSEPWYLSPWVAPTLEEAALLHSYLLQVALLHSSLLLLHLLFHHQARALRE